MKVYTSLGTILLILLCCFPAQADVAIPATALFMGGFAAAFPLLLVVLILETLILWRFWGRSAQLSLLRISGQVAYINILTTILGVIAVALTANLSAVAVLPFFMYFAVTVGLEALMLREFFRKQLDNLSWSYAFKASLGINIPSYLLLAGAIVFLGAQVQQQEQQERSQAHQQAREQWEKTNKGERQLKDHMHTFQALLEVYAIDFEGRFPANTASMAEYVSSESVLQQSLNELTLAVTLHDAETEIQAETHPMSIQYFPVANTQGEIVNYWLYGYNRLGEPVQHNGQIFALSNGY